MHNETKRSKSPGDYNPEVIAGGLPEGHWAKREQIIPLMDVPRHWIKRVHSSVAYRWIDSGADGVVLENFVEVGQRFTTVEALNRFRQRRNAKLGARTHKQSQPRAASARVRDRLAKA